MPIVISAWTGKEMLIDEPGGVAYITHANGDITEVFETKAEAVEAVEKVQAEVVEDAPLEESEV